MKKIITTIFVMVMLVALVGCGSKYKLDGEFTAFEVTEHESNGVNVAQVTWVTVTIKDGKVVKYFLDERQSKIVDGSLVWNAKTKKELKEEYGMTVVPGTIKVEWYLQAQAIEAKWLADGVDSIEVNEENNHIVNMETTATMADNNYSKLARQALDNAKKGVSVAFEVTEHESGDISVAQVTWVEATIKDGKVVKYFLDERQSTVVNGSLAWNAKTKKELKEDYGMTVVPGTIKVEWYLQAQAIEAKWLADGVDSIEVNEENNHIVNMETTATMADNNYSKLARQALTAVGIK